MEVEAEAEPVVQRLGSHEQGAVLVEPKLGVQSEPVSPGQLRFHFDVVRLRHGDREQHRRLVGAAAG